MNKYHLPPLVALILFVVIVGSFGCGSQPTSNQSANTNVAFNANAEAQKAAPSTKIAESECNLVDFETRRSEVHKKIEKKIKDKDSEKGLGKQYADEAFRLVTERYQDHLVVYVAGMVHGSDELEELANILNDFNKKEGGCVSRVAFVSFESLRDEKHREEPGFEWTYCPYDLRPCPDGSCGCRRMKPFNGPSIAGDGPQKPGSAANTNVVNSKSNPSP